MEGEELGSNLLQIGQRIALIEHGVSVALARLIQCIVAGYQAQVASIAAVRASQFGVGPSALLLAP